MNLQALVISLQIPVEILSSPTSLTVNQRHMVKVIPGQKLYAVDTFGLSDLKSVLDMSASLEHETLPVVWTQSAVAAILLPQPGGCYLAVSAVVVAVLPQLTDHPALTVHSADPYENKTVLLL